MGSCHKPSQISGPSNSGLCALTSTSSPRFKAGVSLNPLTKDRHAKKMKRGPFYGIVFHNKEGRGN